MTVRIVRLKNGEDVICNLFEVTMKDDPKQAVALRMDYPYSITIIEPDDEDDFEDGPIEYEIDDEGNAVPTTELVAEDLSKSPDDELEDLPEEDEDVGGIKKMTGLDIDMRPWAPLSKDKHILLKLDGVVSAYETFDIVIEKYNELVEVAKSGSAGN